MILKKEDFEQLGFKHIMDNQEHPVTIICGKAMTAKTFRYDTIEEMTKEPWFVDALNLQGPIILYPSMIDVKDKFCFRMFWCNE